MSSYVVERISGQFEFFMDVSPTWWIKHRERNDEIKHHVVEKFTRDFYPRIILNRGKKEDIGNISNPIRRVILSKILQGEFELEFKPEEEDHKESYLIQNGNVLFSQRCKKQSSRLRILIDGSIERS